MDRLHRRTCRSWIAGLVALGLATAFPGLSRAEDGAARQKDKPGAVGRKVPDFVLPDAAGKRIALKDFRDKPLLVVFFMGIDCPIANLYVKDLSDMQQRDAARGVQVIGIHSGAKMTLERAARHANEFKVGFPVLIDADQRVADSLGVTRTAEVVVFDRDRIVRYRGAVDDRFGYTYKRGQARLRSLDHAVDELLAGKPVSVPETAVRGCLIARGDRPRVPSDLTYSRQIARILQNRCEECHRAGEVAPFALNSYDDAVEHSSMIKEVVLERRMPPWHADPRYGEFSNNRRMTQDEVDQLVAWVDAGTPQGDARDLPARREYPDGWQIGKPDLVFELPKEVPVPATGTIPYLYYAVPTNFKEDMWVEAAEARPGNRSVVHHIIVYYRQPGTFDPVGRLQEHHLCGTAPGDPPLVLPPGTARRIPAGAQLVFQMHYTPNGKEATDRSKVGFVLYKGGKQPHWYARTRAIMNPRFQIPAGDSNYRVESSYTFPEDATIYQLMPHMHLRGKDFLFELTRPGAQPETLLSVPRYDFNWQNTYRFAKPVVVPKGSTLHCVAHFDNSKDNPANPDSKKSVRWGDQTWEEMMIGWMTFAWSDPARQAENENDRETEFE